MTNKEPRTYNWQHFHAASDKVYAQALHGDNTKLANHNILKDGHREITFAFDLAKLYFGHQPGIQVLDVCCGGGYISRCFKDLGFNPIGFDISPEGIELAQSQHPDIEFFVSDATTPRYRLEGQQFDLIYAREAHPFSRIDDFAYQLRIIEDYLSLLRNNGLFVISHATKGGNMNFPSLDFRRLTRYYQGSSVRCSGPFYFFLNKHLRLRPGNKNFLNIVSGLSRIVSSLSGQRWIQFYLLHKS